MMDKRVQAVGSAVLQPLNGEALGVRGARQVKRFIWIREWLWHRRDGGGPSFGRRPSRAGMPGGG